MIIIYRNGEEVSRGDSRRIKGQEKNFENEERDGGQERKIA